jgi:hypothetical protein
MPRRAPDQVQEMRITFGNYEREFVTEVKNDIEKTVKVAHNYRCSGSVSNRCRSGLNGLWNLQRCFDDWQRFE